ncbi:TlpA family protein disulfide reductase [Tenacibaculum aestuariivivum]|uniref:TlpA family protein disulfide reductase n=1 Tax=Tenacibaculum aestuariivivum TaxID=2006131 RepID=UPI003AB395BB
MKLLLSIIILFFFCSCAIFKPKYFTDDALAEKLVTINRDSVTLRDILQKNKNKQYFLQIFATYCPFSQRSFKDVIKFQKENPSLKYIFLSVDHSYFDWKRGLENIKVKGQYYYIPKKGKGKLAEFLKLKTIPRFMIINNKSEIKIFKASSISNRVKKSIY